MAPVEESSDKPAGRDGETDQDVMVPPLTVGVTVVMAVPFVSVNELGLYDNEEGNIVDDDGDISGCATTRVGGGHRVGGGRRPG